MPDVDVEEAELVVTLPENRYFRIEGTDAHDSINGQQVKVVDFGWQREREDLWVMELKNLEGEWRPPLEEKMEDFERSIPIKIVHSLLMLSSVWSGMPFGEALRRELEETFPNFPDDPPPIRVAVLINLDAPQEEGLLLSLTDTLENATAPMGIERIVALPATDDAVTEDLQIRITKKDE
jgi:hypothetical protein